MILTCRGMFHIRVFVLPLLTILYSLLSPCIRRWPHCIYNAGLRHCQVQLHASGEHHDAICLPLMLMQLTRSVRTCKETELPCTPLHSKLECHPVRLPLSPLSVPCYAHCLPLEGRTMQTRSKPEYFSREHGSRNGEFTRTYCTCFVSGSALTDRPPNCSDYGMSLHA